MIRDLVTARRAARTTAGAAAGRPRRAVFHRRLPGGLVAREWLVTAGRPRAAAIKVAMPLVLAVPLAAGGAPTFWAAMLLTVLVAMVGAVGAGVTTARARASGVLDRLLATADLPALTTLRMALAGASVDAAQVAPALVVVIVAGGAGPAQALSLCAVAAAVLLLADALGGALALLAGGPGEVLVDVGVVLAPLLYLGGLFTGVPRTGWRHAVATVDPFAHLHAAFIAALGGAPAFAPGTVTLAALGTAAAATLVALGAGAALGRRR